MGQQRKVIPSSYLGDAVFVGDDPHDVVQGQQGVALDLRVDVLALGADGQQLHQVDVVHQGAVLVHAVPLGTHHLHQGLEGGAVVVEDQDVLARVHHLRGEDDATFELEVLDVSAVGLGAVDEVLNHSLVDLAAQLEVVHEDVLHGDLQELQHHTVSSHVPQQPLLLLPTLLP
ncbi:hypothetical protein EYF80_048501 [Liparis tanakae]|uniref:Uncharacterized protein n=1 Tax=Liparis tanakae TaxID=230148 RepID=A0A4Z2FJE3_9TELE|nr:hypothetical protein EYF80_048501 [Liparis tanakae]